MEEGIEHFKNGLALPDVPQQEQLGLWFELGNAHELLGKPNEALVWYAKVEEVDASFRDATARIERIGRPKTEEQESDEFDVMFDNLIVKE
jgi:predicted TPR repeat methyltransferase